MHLLKSVLMTLSLFFLFSESSYAMSLTSEETQVNQAKKRGRPSASGHDGCQHEPAKKPCIEKIPKVSSSDEEEEESDESELEEPDSSEQDREEIIRFERVRRLLEYVECNSSILRNQKNFALEIILNYLKSQRGAIFSNFSAVIDENVGMTDCAFLAAKFTAMWIDILANNSSLLTRFNNPSLVKDLNGALGYFHSRMDAEEKTIERLGRFYELLQFHAEQLIKKQNNRALKVFIEQFDAINYGQNNVDDWFIEAFFTTMFNHAHEKRFRVFAEKFIYDCLSLRMVAPSLIDDFNNVINYFARPPIQIRKRP